VAQWQSEIVKATGHALTVDYVDYHSGETTRRGKASAEYPDIVLTTYKALEVPKIAKVLNETLWGRVVLVSGNGTLRLDHFLVAISLTVIVLLYILGRNARNPFFYNKDCPDLRKTPVQSALDAERNAFVRRH